MSNSNQAVELEIWRKRAPKCFFCLNVRTGTLGLAIFQIIVHLFAALAIGVFILFPNTLINMRSSFHCTVKSANLIDAKDIPMVGKHTHENQNRDDVIRLNPVIDHNSLVNPKNSVNDQNGRSKFLFNLIAFGHRETVLIKGKEDNSALIISRFISFPRKSDSEISPIVRTNPKIIEKNTGQAVDNEESSNYHDFMPHRWIMPFGMKSNENEVGPNQTRWFKRCLQNLHWNLLIVWFFLSLSILLYYGAKFNKPLYVLPYFVFQFINYVVASFTVVSYLSYLPRLKYWIDSHCNFPLKEQLLGMNDMTLGFLLLSVGLIILAVKAYFMGMVWSCYKYLRAGKSIERIVNTRISRGADTIVDIEPLHLVSDGFHKKSTGQPIVTLPEYEKCLSEPANKFMPPPYFDSSIAKKDEMSNKGPE